ncbi:hypothetical protein MRB53_005536 [Persea americana]|uniref:Uncharacterized protein n=1 Tax=Persea americana TaxID=3435 RepID=A0ACC2ME59_PERAE|nr:hypothetical protein MRB53_005536 [Persea americana]
MALSASLIRSALSEGRRSEYFKQRAAMVSFNVIFCIWRRNDATFNNVVVSPFGLRRCFLQHIKDDILCVPISIQMPTHDCLFQFLGIHLGEP